MSRASRILLINPNTSVVMTAAMLEQARRYIPEDVVLEAVTAPFGSPVVATRVSYTIAAHAVLEAYAKYAEARPDATVLCCFGDPGLEALREVSGRPVIGLAEASIRAAQERGSSFAIVTIGRAWIGMLEERVLLAGAATACKGVYAMDGTGLDVANDPSRVTSALDQLVGKAVRAGAESIVLGGGALAGIADRLSVRARYIDCMQVAIQEALRLAIHRGG